jgi:hypothetical protein
MRLASPAVVETPRPWNKARTGCGEACRKSALGPRPRLATAIGSWKRPLRGKCCARLITPPVWRGAFLACQARLPGVKLAAYLLRTVVNTSPARLCPWPSMRRVSSPASSCPWTAGGAPGSAKPKVCRHSRDQPSPGMVTPANRLAGC